MSPAVAASVRLVRGPRSLDMSLLRSGAPDRSGNHRHAGRNRDGCGKQTASEFVRAVAAARRDLRGAGARAGPARRGGLGRHSRPLPSGSRASPCLLHQCGDLQVPRPARRTSAAHRRRRRARPVAGLRRLPRRRVRDPAGRLDRQRRPALGGALAAGGPERAAVDRGGLHPRLRPHPGARRPDRRRAGAAERLRLRARRVRHRLRRLRPGRLPRDARHHPDRAGPQRRRAQPPGQRLHPAAVQRPGPGPGLRPVRGDDRGVDRHRAAARRRAARALRRGRGVAVGLPRQRPHRGGAHRARAAAPARPGRRPGAAAAGSTSTSSASCSSPPACCA